LQDHARRRSASRARTTKKSDTHVIGLISDTHGLIRPEALEALQGADLIIHAGDIGKPEVLGALKAIAPVLAIKGNNDIGAWAKPLPDTKLVKSGNTRLFVIHNVRELDCDPVARGYQVVVSGHSHKPLVSTRDGVLFVNPGSAGPRRFKLPVAVGKLFIQNKQVNAEIIELPV
jgi:putative phosphoesterase